MISKRSAPSAIVRLLFAIILVAFGSAASSVLGANPVGYVDKLNCNHVKGWAADLDRPNVSLEIEITDIHGSHIDSYWGIIANQPRSDVANLVTHDNGLHGFDFKFNCNLSLEAHHIIVRISGLSWDLGNSPQDITCPSNKDNTAAEPFGTCLGSFNGVEAYSNSSPSYWRCNYDKNCSNPLGTGIKWQCVEFIRRYYLLSYGLNIYSSKVSNARYWFDNAPRFLGLVPYKNGGSTSPQVGDILASKGGKFGHVAIVRSVSSNQVCTIQQNFSENYSDTDRCMDLSVSSDPQNSSAKIYTLKGFNNSATDTMPIQGWLRSPQNNSLTQAVYAMLDIQAAISCPAGSSQGFRINGAAPRHPNGTLVKTANDPTVYLIQNGLRRPITSPAVLYFLYENGEFDFTDVITIDLDEMNIYQLGAEIDGPLPTNGRGLPDGRLIRQVGQPEVSIIADNGTRRPFVSESVFLGLGYQFCNVIDVDDYDSYPENQPIDGTSVTFPAYTGYLDKANCDVIYGWAADKNRPNTPINVNIYADGQFVQTVLANGSRPDVGSVLGDNGLHGFTITTPPNLKNNGPHTITATFETSNNQLGNIKTLNCSTGPSYTGYLDKGGIL